MATVATSTTTATTAPTTTASTTTTTATSTATTSTVPPTPSKPPVLISAASYKTYFDNLDATYKEYLNKATLAFPIYFANPNNVNSTAYRNYQHAMLSLKNVEGGYVSGRQGLIDTMNMLAFTTKKADDDTTALQLLIDNMKKSIDSDHNDALAAHGMLTDRHILYNQYMVCNIILLLVVVAAACLYYYNDNPQMQDLRYNNWLYIPVGISSLSILWYLLLLVMRYITAFFSLFTPS